MVRWELFSSEEKTGSERAREDEAVGRKGQGGRWVDGWMDVQVRRTRDEHGSC